MRNPKYLFLSIKYFQVPKNYFKFQLQNLGSNRATTTRRGMMRTYNIATSNSNLGKSRSKFDAPSSCLRPSKLNFPINNRNSVAVHHCWSFQKAYWTQWHIICWASNRPLHFHISIFRLISEQTENHKQKYSLTLE